MGKFAYAVMMIFTLEIALYLFGGSGYDKTTLFGLLVEPTSIASNLLFLGIIVAVGLVATSVVIPIVAGTSFQINIYAVYASVISVLIYMVYVISNFYSWVEGELSTLMTNDVFAGIITMLICAPFIIFYIIACLEWIRANQ